MHQHNQPNVQNLTIPAITTQVLHEMALRNGQLGNRGQCRATRISSPDSKPQNKGSMGTIVWKQAWLTSTGHTRTKHRHKHNCLHLLQPGTTQWDQGCHLWPNHMFGPTRKSR
jgi:hypothetical protein